MKYLGRCYLLTLTFEWGPIYGADFQWSSIQGADNRGSSEKWGHDVSADMMTYPCWVEPGKQVTFGVEKESALYHENVN